MRPPPVGGGYLSREWIEYWATHGFNEAAARGRRIHDSGGFDWNKP